MIKVGDMVLATGQTGVFVVRSLSKNPDMAEIQLFSVSKQQPMEYKMKVPLGVLSPFKEDASQAAARIVKEATENR
jgi:hypothetical protein